MGKQRSEQTNKSTEPSVPSRGRLLYELISYTMCLPLPYVYGFSRTVASSAPKNLMMNYGSSAMPATCPGWSLPTPSTRESITVADLRVLVGRVLVAQARNAPGTMAVAVSLGSALYPTVHTSGRVSLVLRTTINCVFSIALFTFRRPFGPFCVPRIYVPSPLSHCRYTGSKVRTCLLI